MTLGPPTYGPWHRWFAWHPVRTNWHGWRWLTTVERQQWHGGRSWRGWDYRPSESRRSRRKEATE